jgi:hypothetical protein
MKIMKEVTIMGKVYRYEGEYGVLEVDLEAIKVITDELDREKIWKDAREDYQEQQRIYAEIIEELFGEDVDTIFPPLNKNQFWGGKCTDFGFEAINDEIRIIVDPAGTFIHERNGHRDAYRYYHQAFCVECAFNPYNMEDEQACQRWRA